MRHSFNQMTSTMPQRSALNVAVCVCASHKTSQGHVFSSTQACTQRRQHAHFIPNWDMQTIHTQQAVHAPTPHTRPFDDVLCFDVFFR